MKVTIIKYDITKVAADAIVNAANKTLLGGGGVDGAIHRAAGPELLQECKEIREKHFPDGLPIGSVIATKPYTLPAKYIFHTVGPIYGKDDLSLLDKCYSNCLKLAENKKLETISFPAISTGSFGVPVKMSAQSIKNVLLRFRPNSIREVKLILFDDETLKIYQEIFKDFNPVAYQNYK